MIEKKNVRCCVVGGGPAGMMFSALMARSGIETLVLEKHGDFLRDFRGDTVHPSTLNVMAELGWLDEFLKRPHQKVTRLKAHIEGEEVSLADFRYIPSPTKFIAFMPQWDFLNFIEEKTRQYPTFQISMNSKVTDLIEKKGRIVGVKAETEKGEIEVYSDLIVLANGRNSLLREKAGLKVQDIGAPMDVLWMRVSRKESDPDSSMGWVSSGRIVILIHRGDYWQVGVVIRKGGFEELRRKGIEYLQWILSAAVPFLEDRVLGNAKGGPKSKKSELSSFDQVKLLEVKVDRLQQWWRSGLLCIGDSAHAMSPVGGVGINLAIQDAVAAANILAPAFKEGLPSDLVLKRVQRRREWPTRTTQAIQVLIQKRVIDRVLSDDRPLKVGLIFRLLNQFPLLQGVPAFVMGRGILSEHVAEHVAEHVSEPISGHVKD